jgi:hypothetical protein
MNISKTCSAQPHPTTTTNHASNFFSSRSHADARQLNAPVVATWARGPHSLSKGRAAAAAARLLYALYVTPARLHSPRLCNYPRFTGVYVFTVLVRYNVVDQYMFLGDE